jgi:hypothetical protein
MRIHVLNRASLKCLKIIKHEYWMWTLVLRGPHLMSTANSDICTWDTKIGDQSRVRINVHVGNAHSLECSHSSHLVFNGYEDGAIYMFEDQIFEGGNTILY